MTGDEWGIINFLDALQGILGCLQLTKDLLLVSGVVILYTSVFIAPAICQKSEHHKSVHGKKQLVLLSLFIVDLEIITSKEKIFKEIFDTTPALMS